MIRFYGSITKVDDDQRTVSGYASTEATDSDGEVILRSAIAEALEDYMSYANIREMHQPSAVGVAEEASMDDRGLYITAKVVDDAAWKKVKSGVYKGFSIGGRVKERDTTDRNIIKRINLYEISLVDRPANPEATFDVWKAAASKEDEMLTADQLRVAAAEADELAKAAAATAAAEVLAKAEADKAAEVAAAEALAKAEADKPVLVVIEGVKAEVDDPVAKAEAALAELKAVVDAHTAPVVALSKFDAAMAALVALGDVGAPVVDLFKAAKAEADEAAVAAVAEAVTVAKAAAVVAPSDELAKARADLLARDEAFVKITDGMAALTKRMSDLESTPLPPKTAGAGAAALVIEKGADSAGLGAASAAAAARPEPSTDDVRKLLDSMSEEERAFALMKAAYATPMKLAR